MSSDSSKCSYHVLYAPALLIDHYELKAFTELVYTLTGEKFDKIKGLGFPKAFVKMPSWVKYNENLTATEIYEERY
ncbi:15796_t:CDS:2, partial [Funneliformis geosporum]